MGRGDDSSEGTRAAEETVQARPHPAGEALALVALGEGIAVTAPLPARGRLVLGRSPDAGVRIDHPSVSREHAAVEVTEGGVVLLSDLGSKNGTRVAGDALEANRAVPLSPGVVAEIGEVMLV